MRSTRPRLALALRFSAKRRTRAAMLAGRETLWRTDLDWVFMCIDYSTLHQNAPAWEGGRNTPRLCPDVL